MKKKEVCWLTVAFMSVYHLALIILLPLYLIQKGIPSWGIIISTIIVYCITGLGVTAGYHRFYSHITYKLNPIAEFFMMTAGTLSVASTALKWSYDHRLHHKYVDTEKDPYNINKGFMWAHLWWIFFKRQTWDDKVVKDLLKNKMVVFQDKYYFPLLAASNILLTVFLGWLFNDYFGAIVFTLLFRIFLTHHSMYFINSLAHFYGSKPYSSEHTAVNNWLISLLTFGEGYHNFHHTFAYDYRNGVRWYQFDPTKMLIWTLSKLGIASDLKTVDRYLIYQALIREDERQMLKQIEKIEDQDRKEALIAEVKEKAEALYAQIKELNKKIAEYYKLKKAEKKEHLEELKQLINELKAQFKQAFKEWGLLCEPLIVEHY